MSVAASGPPPQDTWTPRAIRAALIPEEKGAFDREYRQAMAEAIETLDLNGVLELLERWRRIAVLSRDVEAHRRMLDNVARLTAGEDIPTRTWAELKAGLDL